LKRYLSLTPLMLCAVAGLMSAQTPAKIGIIHMQEAILETKDGQKAKEQLQAKFAPRVQQLEKMQADLNSMADQLKKGEATMSPEAKAKMQRDAQTLNTKFQRDQEDFQAEEQQEENRVVQDLGQKMYDVIIKYATQNQLAMVIDVTNPQGPVLWADQGINIKDAIVKLYDQAHPSAGGTAAPATPAARPPATSPAKPATMPPAKKQ
jgi:outer membrane protein